MKTEDLQNILNLHSLWISSDGEKGDLRGVDLRETVLKGANLRGAVLRRADLSGVD